MAELNTEQKRAIKSTILECRGILEKDIEQVLINLGIYIDEEWVDINNLTNLNEEQRKIRENIEQVIEKLCKGGFDKNKAVIEYIKEVSYTYLNRIAALRVLEVRGLIDEILMSRPENGDKSFINSRFYEVAREYCKYNMDAGLSYIINLMFEEIGEEIKLLFSTEDEYSFISPSSNGILAIIKLLCKNIDEESWKQDEIIGWIYQYFNDKEKDDVFDRLYKKKQKIKIEDIPAATQLFTPDWIVKWIVDNSLGELWKEIKEGKRQGKKVEEIKLLDPCCGSGHFLVKAYDLFYKMYLEEGIYSKEEIPFKILENNIYGIDIDLRAIQLTSLILFIKTKTYLKKCNYSTNTKNRLVVNLVCADAILLNGSRLESLKEKHKNNSTVLKMIEIIYEEFKDVKLKGSLIQPEKKLFPLFEEYKNRVVKNEINKVKRSKKKLLEGQITLPNETSISLEDYKSKRDFSKEEKILLDSLNYIYYEAIKANDISRQLFANETVKSVKLVDIFMKQYDVVLTNPPYMGKRNMNMELKEFLNSYYKNFDGDLYSVFIVRGLDFLLENGYLGMITQQSFMFTSTYKALRELVISNTMIKKLLHLGTKAFDEIKGEKVSTASFVLKKSSDKKINENNIGEYFRLTDLKNATLKKDYVKDAEKMKSVTYFMKQSDLNIIKDSPFIYWMTDNIRYIFKKQKTLKDIADCVAGISTGNNAKFLRFIWEKPQNTTINFVNYIKGGEFKKYYGNLDYIINWNLEEIKKESGARVHGMDYFRREGITYSLTSGIGFSARYLPEGYIFDHSGNCIFADNISIYYLLGILNSDLMNIFLGMLNPTLSFQAGDLKRLPLITNVKREYIDTIEKLSAENVKIQKELEKISEPARDFEKPLLRLFREETTIESRYIKAMKYIISKLVIMEKNQNIINTITNDIYNVTEEELNLMKKRIEDEDENININIHDVINNEITTIHDFTRVSRKYGYSIEDIYNLLEEDNNVLRKSLIEEVKKILSYYAGVIFDRWHNEHVITSDDGIIPLDSSIFIGENIVEMIYECIGEDFNQENADDVMDEIEQLLDSSIEEYYMKYFFDIHKSMYQKRPIYWHICTPKRTFNCFIYYHKLDEDTLYKVKSIYLAKMIERYEEDLKYYNEQLIKARIDNDKNKEKDFKIKCSDLEEKLEDLNNLDKKIMEILPYKPDLDQGVLYNIIPLEPILAARVSTDKEREEYYKEVKKK